MIRESPAFGNRDGNLAPGWLGGLGNWRRDFKVSKENTYLKMEYVLIIGDTHLDTYYWRTVDQTGTYVASRRVESMVYFRRKMAAIFRA